MKLIKARACNGGGVGPKKINKNKNNYNNNLINGHLVTSGGYFTCFG